jgi:hypothetical protein
VLVDLLSVLAALALGAGVGLPGLRRRQRQVLDACRRCGRVLVLGERTCDCVE